jgi:hypothetical protein
MAMQGSRGEPVGQLRGKGHTIANLPAQAEALS